MLADAGYHSGVELAAAERQEVRPIVAPRKNRPQKEVGFRKQDFTYDPKTETYTCNRLSHAASYQRSTSKKSYRVKRYTTPACTDCPLKPHCTTSSMGRYIERPLHQVYTDRNNRRVTHYPTLYRQRQAIIEHIFGTWERHWGMNYAMVKGKEKVETEYWLTAINYNLLRTAQVFGLEKLRD